MKARYRALPCAAAAAILATVTAHAQTPSPDGPRYVVGYVELMPGTQNDGAAVMRQFRDASRQEAGNLRLEAGQRVGRPNQFVILEAWKDQSSFDAHAKDVQTLRAKLAAIQQAPYDERVHFALSVGPLPADLGGAAVFTVTHIDVVPTQREAATVLVRQLAENGRQDDGNRRFEALTQTARQNHFTVVAAWRDHQAADAHGTTAKTRAFRDQLAPAIGALYDERFYRALE